MLKSPLRIVLVTVTLIFAVLPLQHVHGILLSRAELTAVAPVDNPAVSNDTDKQSSRGNAFVRALAAPFRAIGRLFGHKKKDDNKLQRITEKDIRKFESVPATRTETPAQRSQIIPADMPSAGAAAALNHLQRGREALEASKLNEAIQELSTAVSLDPKLTEARTLLGVAYDRKGLNDLARQTFEVALHDPSDEAMHLNNLGYLQYKQGEYKEAVKYLKRAAKLAPTDERIWNNLGLAQAELGKYDDAYKSFARVAGEFNGRVNVAARLEIKGESEKAIKNLRKALELQPKSRQVLAQLATLYDRTGQIEEAQKARESLAAQIVVAEANQPKQ